MTSLLFVISVGRDEQKVIGHGFQQPIELDWDSA
jgi:hypothetical protein